MRLLRLDLGCGQTGVDLHPFVTVVRGLDPAQRTELLDAVVDLAGGWAAGTRGLLAHQGLLLELDGADQDHFPALGGVDVVIEADPQGNWRSGSWRCPPVALGPPTLEAVLARLTLVADQVTAEGCGSVPVAVLGTFPGLSDAEVHRLLDGAVELAAGIQIVVVTERRAAHAWAAAAGLRQALLSTPRPIAPVPEAPGLGRS